MPRLLKHALIALSAFFALILILLLSMTSRSVATPVFNRALSLWGPDGARLESGHLGFPALLTIYAERIDVPDRLTAERTKLQVNPLGFLPGLVWVSRIEGDTLTVTLPESIDNDTDSNRLNPRRIVDDFNLTNMTVNWTANAAPRQAIVKEALGSLHSGTFRLSATSGETGVFFDGKSLPGDIFNLDGIIQLQGPNTAHVAALFGLAAPDSPPYDLTASLDIDGHLSTVKITSGTIGDSDIIGDLTIDTSAETPRINADLSSDTLDFDDLGIIFGIPIGIGDGETANAQQEAARESYNADTRLIPNAAIDFSRLDAVDGEVTYTARNVTDSVFTLTGLGLKIDIEGRLVRAESISLAFPKGRLQAYATLDGSQDPAVTDIEGSLSGVAFSSLAAGPLLRGHVEGDFKFTVAGNNFRAAAASADGAATLWSTDGEVLALGAEAAGLDLGEALVLLTGESDQEPAFTPARCMVAGLDLTSGTAALSPVVADTRDSVLIADGTIDLSTETLDISVRAEAKDLSWGALVGDIDIGGTLRDPAISVLGPETILQVTIAGLLGAVAAPLAALPFADINAESNAPCAALLARAQASSPS